jgi:parvulin-like peptidyl-prolyl isomerase
VLRRLCPLSTLVILSLHSSALGGQDPVPSHQPAGRPLVQEPATRAKPPVVVSVNGVDLLADRLQAAMNEIMPYGVYHVGISPERRAELRKQALDKLVDEELLYQEATKLGLVAPKAEIDQEYARVRRRYATERDFRAALARAGSSVAQVRAEARRRALIRQVSERTVDAHCRVTEAEAREYYASNTAKFVMPEQLHLFTLTLGVDRSAPRADWDAATKRAEDLLAQLRSGADFAPLARQHSTDPNKDKGGDLGYVHRGRLNEEFEKALADVRPGAFVGPIQTIYGVHVLHVTEVRPPVQRTFADVRVALLTELRQKRCDEVRAAWLQSLREHARIVIAEPAAPGGGAAPPSPGQ